MAKTMQEIIAARDATRARKAKAKASPSVTTTAVPTKTQTTSNTSFNPYTTPITGGQYYSGPTTNPTVTAPKADVKTQGSFMSAPPMTVDTTKPDGFGNYNPASVAPKEVVPEYVPPVAQPFNEADFNKRLDDKFNEYMKNKGDFNYNSKYDQQLTDALNKINSGKQFQFDPNDPGLKQLQDQSIQRVRQDMARRGRVFDTYAGIKEQEAAQQLIPEYYRAQQDQFNRDRQYDLQGLSALTGAEKTDYGRALDRYGMGATDAREQLDYQTGVEQTAYGRGQTQRQQDLQATELERRNTIADEDRMIQQEVAQFGVPLSQDMRQYTQTFETIPQEMRTSLSNQYGNNYAARILELRASGENPQELQALETLRAMKVLSDPALLKKYGDEYGMQSGAITEMGTGAEQEAIKQEIEVIKQEQQVKLQELKIESEKITNIKQKNEADKVLYEIDKLIVGMEETLADIENKNQDTQNKMILGLLKEQELLQAELTTSNLPNVFKQKADESLSVISRNIASSTSSYASGRASDALASLRGKQELTEAEKTLKTKAETEKINKGEEETYTDIINKNFGVKGYRNIGEYGDEPTYKETGKIELTNTSRTSAANWIVKEQNRIAEKWNSGEIETEEELTEVIDDLNIAIDTHNLGALVESKRLGIKKGYYPQQP